MSEAGDEVGAVAIGRNEGERLRACLASLTGLSPVVYVDSGSTDGSVAMAREMGAEVVALDMSRPFTAARARNEGLARLREAAPDLRFVQLLDGDCELVGGFVPAALAAMKADVAVVCGRRRERHPQASLWNALTDFEWDTPVGEAKACGGDALMRLAALDQVGGYRDDLIAGEEPEMCLRMRGAGWRILRIDAEMTRHDAAMTRTSQWWQRNRRAGHAFAEGAALHPGYRRREVRSLALWGIALPLVLLLGVFLIGSAAFLLLLAWPLQMLRLRAKGEPWMRAIFLTLGKLAEAQGALGYWLSRARGRRRGLIEYK